MNKAISFAIAPLAIAGVITMTPLAVADTGHGQRDIPAVTQEVALTTWSTSIDALPEAPVFSGPVPQGPKKNNDWLRKTQAFTECIFMVGIPIGAAWAIVTNPPLLAYAMRMGPLPATSGGTAVKYVEKVRASCGYALF